MGWGEGFNVWVKANSERFSCMFRIILWEWKSFQIGGKKKSSKILPFRDPYERGDSALVFL